MIVPVELTMWEMVYAAVIGVVRHYTAITNNSGKGTGYPATEEDSLVGHINGAAGECACAKALGLFWEARINNFTGPDIGTDIQVKTTFSQWGQLAVRDIAENNHRYYLVVGAAPYFEIKGWIYAGDAKYWPLYDKNHRGKPAHFVPQNVLCQIGENYNDKRRIPRRD